MVHARSVASVPLVSMPCVHPGLGIAWSLIIDYSQSPRTSHLYRTLPCITKSLYQFGIRANQPWKDGEEYMKPISVRRVRKGDWSTSTRDCRDSRRCHGYLRLSVTDRFHGGRVDDESALDKHDYGRIDEDGAIGPEQEGKANGTNY